MVKKSTYYILLTVIAFFELGCSDGKKLNTDTVETAPVDSIPAEAPAPKERTPLKGGDIQIEKAFEFDKYLLEDSYAYKDTTRQIKWPIICDSLAVIENSMQRTERWGVIQNYKNMNGEAKLIKTWHRNEYKLVTDSLGVSRYQSIPLFLPIDSVTPRRYGRDGTPIHLLDSVGSFYKLVLIDSDEEWLVPRRYVKLLPDTVQFTHAVFIDVADQNITLLRRESEGHWKALSTNPATTGKHNPPYGHETPLGIFMIQQKKRKMFYYRDGTTNIVGYAPYASRFTNGAYIHGVPTQNPKAKEIEYSHSLGTTPRSHMCVRNASSHAKFVYENAPTDGTFVVVIE